MKLGKRDAMRMAKSYVAELISNQDTPDWLFDVAGVSLDDEISMEHFNDAIERISRSLDPSMHENKIKRRSLE